MNITNLTIEEITELQPTETAYAAEHGRVLGGVEVAGDIDHEKLGAAIKQQFGSAEVYGEGMDGDDCVHYVVIAAAAE